jgi:propionyl-CoA synthetase
MIPAAVFGILAASRLGAVHAIVFGGFSGPALAQRIDDAKPKVILTASCSVEGKKGPLPYQPFLREAYNRSPFKPEKILVWQREEYPWTPLVAAQGELNWNHLVQDAKRRNLKAEAVPVRSNDPIYVLFTSGEPLSRNTLLQLFLLLC